MRQGWPDGAFELGTFIGASSDHHPNAVVYEVDAEGGTNHVYVAGSARPHQTRGDATPDAFQNNHAGGLFDGFIAKVSADLNQYAYFTFLGGSGRDVIMDIETHSGYAYVVGNTTSLDFPVTEFAHQTSHSMVGVDVDCSENSATTIRKCSDVFVARLASNGSSLAFSTYVGANDEDFARGVAVASNGQPVITGASRKLDDSGETNVFIKRFESLGSAILQNVLIPGLGFDHGEEIVIDSLDRSHVVGTISLAGQTNGNGAQQYHGDPSDIFYTRVTAAGQIDYFSYIGGSAEDRGFAVAADGEVNGTYCAMVAGSTVSADIAVINELQSEQASSQADILLTLVCDIPPNGDVIPEGNFLKNVSQSVVQEGETIIFTVTVINGSDFDIPAKLTDVVPPQINVTNVYGVGCTRLNNSVNCDNGFILHPGPTTIVIEAVGNECPITVINQARLEIGDTELLSPTASVTVSCIIPPLGPACGDGTVDSGEECDWNNPATAASCRQDCTFASCGDGITDEFRGEVCDDGNANNVDSCTNVCTSQLIEDQTCFNQDISCANGLVCGKRCTFVDDTICIGIPTDGGCIGIPIGDTYQLCDVDATCMPESEASGIFN